MEKEKRDGEELDYCDLDPSKICDNCYKCIEREDESFHTFFARLMPQTQGENVPEFEFEYISASQAEEEGLIALENLLIEREGEDEYVLPALEDEFEFGENIPPVDIDPELLKEWELRLADLEDEDDLWDDEET